ncbi:MAG: hypothetical protein WBM86_12810 [Waterburya sp.]
MQALGMRMAIAILNRVDIEEFKESTAKALSTIIEGDIRWINDV